MDARTPFNTRAGLIRVLDKIRLISAREAATHDGYYRVDRSDAWEYLWARDKWKKLVLAYFKEVRSEGDEVVYADICGRCNAFSMGVKTNYSFALQPAGYYFLRSKRSIEVVGNIMHRVEFNRFVQRIKDDGHRLSFATFVPIVGLQPHIPELHDELHQHVVYAHFAKCLAQLIGVMRPGGLIYLESPFQFMNFGDWFNKKPVEEYESSLWLKALCTRLGCSLSIDRSIGGPQYLIRTRRKRKKKTAA
jgi:hypothetical protein